LHHKIAHIAINISRCLSALVYSAVKLFSKYFNVSDHGTWTSVCRRTDIHTDDILWHDRALRGIAR